MARGKALKGKCQYLLTEFKNMREKALAVDNNGRISVEDRFEINLIVDNFARKRSLLVKADVIFSAII